MKDENVKEKMKDENIKEKMKDENIKENSSSMHQQKTYFCQWCN